MAEIVKIDSEKARFDPESVFARPSLVAEEAGLTRGQKIATLERWEQQVLDRLAATSEGMPANDTSAHEADLLAEIKATLADLQDATAEE